MHDFDTADLFDYNMLDPGYIDIFIMSVLTASIKSPTLSESETRMSS
jgi:hypothetical protein